MLNKKQKRLNKILRPKDGRTLLVAFDHGVEHGPSAYEGISLDPLRIVKIARMGGADGIIVHSGIARYVRKHLKGMALIVKITGKTRLCKRNFQEIVTTVREAEVMGADGIACTVYVGSDEEPEMLRNLAFIKEECLERGMPLIGFMYPRVKGRRKNEFNAVRYAARLGAELGVDIVKTYYTGSKETFEKVINDCFVPLISAGGEKTERIEEFLKMAKDIMDAGASGMAVGRNVWTRNNGVEILKKLRKIIHGEVE